MSLGQESAWDRANVPKAEWLRAVRVALKRHVEAATERHAFYEKQGEVIEMSQEEDHLRIEDDKAEKAWRDAIAGDPGVIAELLKSE